MANLLLKLNSPYLTPIEAEEIRAEIVAQFKPRLHLVLADWPWLEVRGITELRAKALVEKLQARGMKFRVMEKKKREVAA